MGSIARLNRALINSIKAGKPKANGTQRRKASRPIRHARRDMDEYNNKIHAIYNNYHYYYFHWSERSGAMISHLLSQTEGIRWVWALSDGWLPLCERIECGPASKRTHARHQDANVHDSCMSFRCLPHSRVVVFVFVSLPSRIPTDSTFFSLHFPHICAAD